MVPNIDKLSPCFDVLLGLLEAGELTGKSFGGTGGGGPDMDTILTLLCPLDAAVPGLASSQAASSTGPLLLDAIVED